MVETGRLSLHGWHYVIEHGEIQIFQGQRGRFLPASEAANSGTEPYAPYVEHGGQVFS